MNTLQDLRDTLDRHTVGVHDYPATARVAAVRGRARVVRRRRAAAVGSAAVLAVVGITAVTALPDRTPAPAAAPDTQTSLGWTYRLESTESGDGRVSVRLPDSDTPRLVSWATAGGEQRVAVRQPGVESRTAESGDYADFVWVPPGPGGRVSVISASGGSLDLAVYELDASVAPPGVGQGVLTFREDVAGASLLGAHLGEPGEASIEVDLTPTSRMVWIATTCGQLPRGTRVHVGWADERGSFSSGACDSGSVFDPGGSPATGFAPGRRAGRESTLRMWLTSGGERVADGGLPGVRLGVGAYTPSEQPADLAGMTAAQRIEHDGRVWQLEEVAATRGGELPELTVPEEGRYLVTDSVAGRGLLRYALTLDGRRTDGGTTYVSTGGGGGGRTPVAPGQTVSMWLGTPAERLDAAGLALYRLVD